MSTPLAEAIGWAILHSIWQGAVFAVLMGCTLIAKPESFFVTKQATQLLPGESARARAWGERLAAAAKSHPQEASPS